MLQSISNNIYISRRYPQKFFFKTSVRLPNLSSTGFCAVNKTEAEEPYPNIITTEIAQEDKTESSVDGNDSVIPEDWANCMSTDEVKLLFYKRIKTIMPTKACFTKS